MDFFVIALILLLGAITTGIAFILSLFTLTEHVRYNDHSEYLEDLEEK